MFLTHTHLGILKCAKQYYIVHAKVKQNLVLVDNDSQQVESRDHYILNHISALRLQSLLYVLKAASCEYDKHFQSRYVNSIGKSYFFW